MVQDEHSVPIAVTELDGNRELCSAQGLRATLEALSMEHNVPWVRSHRFMLILKFAVIDVDGSQGPVLGILSPRTSPPPRQSTVEKQYAHQHERYADDRPHDREAEKKPEDDHDHPNDDSPQSPEEIYDAAGKTPRNGEEPKE